MKKLQNRCRIGLLCLISILAWGKGLAQTAECINSIRQPHLFYGQQVKGIFYICANGLSTSTVPKVLTKNMSGGLSFADKDDTLASQLWYVVQDYNASAFALVNAADTSWLSFNNAGVAITDATPVTAVVDGVPSPDKRYMMELVKPNDTGSDIPNGRRLYALRSTRQEVSDTDSRVCYVQQSAAGSSFVLKRDFSSTLRNSGLQSSRATFMIVPIAGNAGVMAFTAVPFQVSNYHHYSAEAVAGIGILTRIIRKVADTTDFANDFILSGRANVIGAIADSLLCIDFSKAKRAFIGWMSYEKADYSLQAIRQSSPVLLKPRFGVGVSHQHIYVINGGTTDVLTSPFTFSPQRPVYISYRGGRMTIFQLTGQSRVDSVSYRDVPVSSILSSGIGSKAELVARVRYKDTLTVGYKPGAVVFSRDDVGRDLPSFATTNPDFPYMPPEKGSLCNNFDWRAQVFQLRYKSNGQVVEEEVCSPFYSPAGEFTGISAKYTPDGTKHIGGEDSDPYEGWEMIKSDLGYKNNGEPNASANLRNEPYIILYNRFYGTLRVFAYINNASIANNYKVSLSAENAAMHSNTSQYKPPYLWSSFLEGLTMDRDELSSAPYYKSKQLSSSSSGKFYYADFNIGYDPCVAFFESAIRVSLEKVTSGTMQMVGRSLGGVIPGGLAINDWMSKNDNFVQGALNQPYGTLSQTIGDMTMSNYKSWGMDSLMNYAGLVIPGKKVEDWQRKAAQYDWESTVTRGNAQLLSGAGAIIKATGEAAGVVGSGIVNVGAPLKAAGTYIEAGAKFLEASGTFVAADAARLRYDNLKDEPDKHLKITLPDPQPSLVFSDMAIQGSLSITSSVFNDILLTTPGSKNSKFAPESKRNGTKGSFPLYNEPLGIYAVLNKPEFDIVVVRAISSPLYDAAVALKERPVVIVNPQPGLSQILPWVAVAVTTYDKSGVVVRSRATKSYLLTNNPTGLPAELRLPEKFDVSKLIDQTVLEDNFKAINGAGKTDAQLSVCLSSWIKVELVAGINAFGPKLPSGSYSGCRNNISFKSANSCTFARHTGNTVSGAAQSQLNSKYNLGNNRYFGNNYVLSRLDSTFTTLMENYCKNHQTTRIQNARAGWRTEGDTTQLPASEASRPAGLTICPNPASQTFTVSYEAETAGEICITLYDIIGKKLVKHKDHAQTVGEKKEILFDVGTLSKGIYVVTVILANGKKLAGKVVKQ